mmetsp:Transcript_31002/g.78064  ORF Transcript_31002/g.78064 Transcript_31002/m.78064 type:complete len:289 (-) Transcript_31002:235-1101(-)
MTLEVTFDSFFFATDALLREEGPASLPEEAPEPVFPPAKPPAGAESAAAAIGGEASELLTNGSTPTPPRSQKEGFPPGCKGAPTRRRCPHLGAHGAPPLGVTTVRLSISSCSLALDCPPLFSKSTAFSAPSAVACAAVQLDDRKQRCSKPKPPGCQCQKVADLHKGCMAHFSRHLSRGVACKFPRSRRPAQRRRGWIAQSAGGMYSTWNCCSPVGKRTTPDRCCAVLSGVSHGAPAHNGGGRYKLRKAGADAKRSERFWAASAPLPPSTWSMAANATACGQEPSKSRR